MEHISFFLPFYLNVLLSHWFHFLLAKSTVMRVMCDEKLQFWSTNISQSATLRSIQKPIPLTPLRPIGDAAVHCHPSPCSRLRVLRLQVCMSACLQCKCFIWSCRGPFKAELCIRAFIKRLFSSVGPLLPDGERRKFFFFFLVWCKLFFGPTQQYPSSSPRTTGYIIFTQIYKNMMCVLKFNA